MTQRTENAINVLLNAIDNNTLAKGSSTACAVGNLIANSMGAKITIDDKFNIQCNENVSFWSDLFLTAGNVQTKYYKHHPHLLENLSPNQKKSIENTGFSIDEIAKIEYTFEKNTQIGHSIYNLVTKEQIKQDQLKGLTAVVNLLFKMDNDTKTNINAVFTSKVKKLQSS